MRGDNLDFSSSADQIVLIILHFAQTRILRLQKSFDKMQLIKTLLIVNFFVLSVLSRNFSGPDWMGDSMDLFGGLTLQNMTLPGTHDSGVISLLFLTQQIN